MLYLNKPENMIKKCKYIFTKFAHIKHKNETNITQSLGTYIFMWEIIKPKSN